MLVKDLPLGGSSGDVEVGLRVRAQVLVGCHLVRYWPQCSQSTAGSSRRHHHCGRLVHAQGRHAEDRGDSFRRGQARGTGCYLSVARRESEGWSVVGSSRRVRSGAQPQAQESGVPGERVGFPTTLQPVRLEQDKQECDLVLRQLQGHRLR